MLTWDLIVQSKVLLHLFQTGDVFGCQFSVVFEGSVVHGVVFVSNVYIYLASLDIGFHQVADGTFQEAYLLGHFYAQIQISVVDDFNSMVIFLSSVTTSARPKPVMLFIIVFLFVGTFLFIELFETMGL